MYYNFKTEVAGTKFRPTEHRHIILFSNVLQDFRPTHKFRAVTHSYLFHSSDKSQFRFSNIQEDKVLDGKTEILPMSTPFSF